MPNQRKRYYDNSLTTPIYQTSTYYFESTDEVIKYHNGEKTHGRYGRYDNPSWLEVESQLAELDKFQEALIFPSGMNAIATTLLTFLQPGDEVIFTGKGYRNVRNLCENILSKFNVKPISISPANDDYFFDEFKRNYNSKTKIIFIETPSNPHLYIVDIERIKSIIQDKTLLIIDSTFSTPINFQPKSFGADLVIHSCGKYIGGHSDIMIGSVSGSHSLISEIRNYRNVLGCICDPNTAFLLNRSLATLKLRMEHLNKNGLVIATFLQNHPKVKTVFYTGLDNHPHFEIAKKYLSGHGGIITFELDCSTEQCTTFVDILEIPFMGTNFGSQFSMVEQCSIFTYYKQTAYERRELGISAYSY